MKKSFAMSLAAFAVMTASNTASAFFWDSDDDWKCMGPYGEIPGCNPYDEWDPRYWMEEMEAIQPFMMTENKFRGLGQVGERLQNLRPDDTVLL